VSVTVPTVDRVLPHDLEAERSILGAILVENSGWAKAAAIIAGASFYRDAHRRIWEAMQRLAAAGSALDFGLLRSELHRTGEEDEVGGAAYIASLVDGVPRSVNVEHYCRVVRAKALLRETIYAANQILTNAYDAETDPAMIVEDGVTRLLSLARPESAGPVRIGTAALDYLLELETPPEAGLSVATGFADLDEMLLGGFQRKRLVMIAGRPGMGKTTLAMNIAEHAAESGGSVVVFSLEQDRRALAEMAVARQAGIDSHRLRARAIGQKDGVRLAAAVERLGRMRLLIVDDVLTQTQMQAWARRLSEEHEARLFIVDYLQLMGDLKARDRRVEVDQLSREFKRMAKDLDAVVVVLSQLTRGPEQRADKRPQMSDLKESGALEADADHIVLIYRDDAYNRDPNNPEAGIAELILAKNKGGPTGVARVAYIREQSRFASLAMWSE